MISPEDNIADKSQIGLSAQEKSKQEDAHAIEEGLLAILHPSISSLDAKVYNCKRSQSELSACIDSVTADLKRISDSMPNPQHLDGHIKKLAHARRKINVVNSILHNCQERLRRVHQSVVRDTTNKQQMIATLSNQQPQPVSTSQVSQNNPPQSTIVSSDDNNTNVPIATSSQDGVNKPSESSGVKRVESTPEAEPDGTPIESAQHAAPSEAEPGPTPIESTPEAEPGATPIESTPEAEPGGTPIESTPEAEPGGTPIESAQDAESGATPIESAQDAAPVDSAQPGELLNPTLTPEHTPSAEGTDSELITGPDRQINDGVNPV